LKVGRKSFVVGDRADEFEQLQRGFCETKLAEMKSKWETENETLLTRIGPVERGVSLLGNESSGEDHEFIFSGHSTDQYCSVTSIADRYECG
jgi:hypothetical protein